MRIDIHQPDLSRRGFLRGTAAGAGLLLATHVAASGKARAAAPGASFASDPNAFLRIAPDDTVTVLVKHIEFGQGTNTGLATMVAEELDADWSQMRAESAPANTALYKNLFWGVQGTGGSSATPNSYIQMRTVGATARAMLVAAAAARWGVPAGEITVSKGVVRHGGKSARFGELAEAAMSVTPPKDVKLKDPKDFTLIGNDLPKLDTPEKVNGTAVFTIDVQKPGMLTVLVKHPTRFGAKVKSFDASAAQGIQGFVDAKAIPAGVAVYADGFWAAKTARDAITVEWDETGTESRSSAQIIADYTAKLDETGLIAGGHGKAAATLDALPKERVFEADYVYPYLAHAPMEPLDCVIERVGDGVVADLGSQLPTVDQNVIAGTLGLKPDQVTVNVLYAGGSFGRRAQPSSHLAAEAAAALKAGPDGRPLKLVWTREDDIKGGYYRPIYVHRMRAGLDENGDIVAWQHRIAGQSIVAGSPFEGALVKDGIDKTSVEGGNALPYRIPNFSAELHTMPAGVPVLWWRAVGSTHTGFSVEAFLDELLVEAKRDPVEGRLKLLADSPREAGVLKAVAEAADWGRDAPDGRAFGVAVHKSFGTYVAQIAEIGLDADGNPKVHKVWCAVDCGLVLNPEVVKAQMEGGIGYGLGAALYNEVTIKDGRVAQSNFDDYWPLRITDMPDIEVAIVKSDAPPTGVGEPATPVIAPAVANGFYRLTGKRLRKMPFVDVPGLTGTGI